jgi:hypothetical protein
MPEKKRRRFVRKDAKEKPVGAYLDADLYRQARARALLEGRRVGELISQAIQEYLKNHKV